MAFAQNISSLVHSLRKKETIKVRQPLQKILIPSKGQDFESQILAVEDLIKTEVNIKDIEFISENSDILIKNIKPNFAKLGKVFGKNMKLVAAEIANFLQSDIREIEKGQKEIIIENTPVKLSLDDVEISSKDIPGLLVASENGLTVALDIEITETLKNEGIARELVNRIQNLRKDKGLDVQDRINISIKENTSIHTALEMFRNYICVETQADSLLIASDIKNIDIIEIDNLKLEISIN